MALIAYQDPYDSPLSHLMGNAQREKVADAINAAVLSAATTGASTGNKTSSGGPSAGHSNSSTSSTSAPQPRVGGRVRVNIYLLSIMYHHAC